MNRASTKKGASRRYFTLGKGKKSWFLPGLKKWIIGWIDYSTTFTNCCFAEKSSQPSSIVTPQHEVATQ